MPDSPLSRQIRTFICGINANNAARLGEALSRDVDYSVEGLFDIRGRQRVVDHWRRAFSIYAVLHIHLIKCVSADDLVIAQQRHVLTRRDAGRIELPNMAVYRVGGDGIVEWRNFMDLALASSADLKLWRRLKDARW